MNSFENANETYTNRCVSLRERSLETNEIKIMKSKTLCLLVVLLFLNTMLYGQKTTTKNYSVLIDEYSRLIENKMKTDGLIGVSAALIMEDSVIWKKGFGFADKENKIPMTTATNLSIGSLTKSFTALGIMQLSERQLLDINNPLIEYLPEFSIQTRKTDIKDINIKSLLIHSSGIPNSILLNADSETEKYTDMVKYLKNEYLGYPPNFEFHYSNAAYSILGHVILKISQKDYPNYIHENILSPSGMNNSGFNGYQPLTNISRTYTRDGEYYPLRNMSRNIPAGGMVSNVDDLISFSKELISIYHGKQESIIKPETLKEIFCAQNEEILIEDFNTSFGWFIYKNDSCFAVHNTGSTHLSNSGLWILPEQKMAAIFLVNTVGGLSLVNQCGNKLLKEIDLSSKDLFRKYSNNSNESKNIPIDSLKKYEGLYSGTRNIIKVELDNNQLVMNTGNNMIYLKPTTGNKFEAFQINSDEKTQHSINQKYSFENIFGYTILFAENDARKYSVGHRLDNQNINEDWKKRVGKYKIDGNKLKAYESFSEADLYITNDNILQLKIYYTSGMYTYNLDIASDNELIICGFNESGGQTIFFVNDKEKTTMTIFGLIMKKSD